MFTDIMFVATAWSYYSSLLPFVSTVVAAAIAAFQRVSSVYEETIQESCSQIPLMIFFLWVFTGRPHC